MAKYILKLDSQYDEHLGHESGGKKYISMELGDRSYLDNTCDLTPRLMEVNSSNFPSGTSGDGYYIMSGGQYTKYNVVGTEERQYTAPDNSAQTGTFTSSATFTILENADNGNRVWWTGELYMNINSNSTYWPVVFVQTGDSSSVLSATTNMKVSYFRFADYHEYDYMNNPVPGVGYVEDGENEVTGVCYNKVSPGGTPEKRMFSFPESSATYTWAQCGITESWYNEQLDFALAVDGRKDPKDWLFCIKNVAEWVPEINDYSTRVGFWFDNDPRPANYRSGRFNINNKRSIEFSFVDTTYQKYITVTFNWQAQTIEVETTDYDPG